MPIPPVDLIGKYFSKGVKRNLVIYTVCILIACAGIIYGNAIKPDHSFLRVWELQNIFILLLGYPFLFLQGNAGIPTFVKKGFPTNYDSSRLH
jgi:hypothetical protein